MALAASTAIILHGPPGVWKSTVSDALRTRYSDSRHISLDQWWGAGELRYRGGADRYADLRQAKELLLVVELGWGEPVGLAFAGATRAAGEWVSVLREAGRRVVPFLLWAEFDDLVRRLFDRQAAQGDPRPPLSEVGIYTMYEHRHPLFTFPPIPDFQEERIVTTGRTPAEVAEELLQRCGR